MKLLTLLTFLVFPLASAAERKPNFLIILSDDAGYADFGFQEKCSPEMKAVTPTLTKLASEGVRFTDGYVSGSVCSPSRAGMMTGRYQQRFGHATNIPAGYMKGGLPLTEKFIGDQLKPLGYSSGIVGKWHLGYPEEYWPEKRGFDQTYAFLQGARPYFPFEGHRQPPHQQFMENGKVVPEEGYTTDRIGNAACRFIEQKKDQPWFLYVSFNAAHEPLQARKEDLPGLQNISNPKHRQYAGVVKAMDDNVAKILAKLDALGLAKDTLVIFTNDNGGQTAMTASNAPLHGKKGDVWDGGVRVPMIMRWPGVIAPGRVVKDPVISLDFATTFLAAAGGQPLPDHKLDGVNLLPLLKENKPLAERALFWRSAGSGSNCAVRQGDWKLVWNRREPNAKPMLFHLREDIGESKDLSAEQPEKVTAMLAALSGWEKELIEPLWHGQQKPPRRAGGGPKEDDAE